jgi:hypothetical protein
MDGNTQFYIAYASIIVNGVSAGYTDGYGRIQIDRPPGSYKATLVDRGVKKTMNLVIDNSHSLKKTPAVRSQ